MEYFTPFLVLKNIKYKKMIDIPVIAVIIFALLLAKLIVYIMDKLKL